MVTELPRPATLARVDARALLKGDVLPEVDSESGVPCALRALVFSQDPKMVVIPQLFSQVECEHLVRLVEGYWMPSLVGKGSEEEYKDSQMQNSISKTRTSWSCQTRPGQDAIIERLEQRLAKLANLPVENLERLNMVRYTEGQLFDEHHDGFFRPKTLFVYLNDLPDDDDGGDTFFPFLGMSVRCQQGVGVMWSNQAENGFEDSRMVHKGCAPNIGVKYGVNCFFNSKPVRHFGPDYPDFSLEDATRVDVRGLGRSSSSSKEPSDDAVENRQGKSEMVCYILSKEPRLTAISEFLSAEEVQHLLHLVEEVDVQGVGPRRGATQTIRTLEAAETQIVDAIEQRIGAADSLPMANLARLRVVHPGTIFGLCNRGCGFESAYVCLSDAEEVFFPKLGVCLALKPGDALFWPNVYWELQESPEEKCTYRVQVEDSRTTRVHWKVSREGPPARGLEAYWHDNEIREQQKKRPFKRDSGPPQYLPLPVSAAQAHDVAAEK